jgi:hypothetical protein
VPCLTVGEYIGSPSHAKTKVLGAMKEAKPGNIHYIFLKAYVNEPIISMLKLLGNVPDKFCSHLNRRTEQLKLDRRV